MNSKRRLKQPLIMSGSPVVDFGQYGLNVQEIGKVKDETLKELGKDIVKAFRTFGFCYLLNHGVDENIINDYMTVSRAFFEQPVEVKAKLPIDQETTFGWLRLEGEVLNTSLKTGDYKESFNYKPCSGKEIWPPVENFKAQAKEFFDVSSTLALRVLDVLSLGLDLPVDLMRGYHRFVGGKDNHSNVRSLYYPPIPADYNTGSDQARLSEHIDYGTFACIFQDSIGGLQAKNPEGEYVPVTPIPGTVVVAVGALLQRWTSDYLQGTMHRVLMPMEAEKKKLIRQSLVFFLDPDRDCVVTCLDGSDKYEPTSAQGFIDDKFSKQYL